MASEATTRRETGNSGREALELRRSVCDVTFRRPVGGAGSDELDRGVIGRYNGGGEDIREEPLFKRYTSMTDARYKRNMR